MLELKQKIKTPTNVEEFRENLKKYCVGYGKNEIWVNTYHGTKGVPINKINDIVDLYKYGKNPRITYQVKENISPWDWYLKQDYHSIKDRLPRGTKSPYWVYWNDSKNYELYDNEVDFFKNVDNPFWRGLDDIMYVELMVKLFGKFSGYKISKTEMKLIENQEVCTDKEQ